MKILVSNDDGIASMGINSLANALKEIGEVTVVAPRTEQSAVGHAITMKNPLRITKFYNDKEFFGYAVDGTPADCVKMGCRNILSETPDIVVSGINHGSNTAINIIYSGTVSAAREAAIMDIPSIAFSVTSHDADDFTAACNIAKKLVKEVLKRGIPKGTLLNVNIPNVPENEIKGVRVTKQGRSRWDDSYIERVDPYGQKYYWLTGTLDDAEGIEGCDQNAIHNNYISVTPIQFDLTDYSFLESIKEWNIEENY